MNTNKLSMQKTLLTILLATISYTFFAQRTAYTKEQRDSAIQSIMCDSMLNIPLRPPAPPRYEDGAMLHTGFVPIFPTCFDSTGITYCDYVAKKACSERTIKAFISEHLGFPQELPPGESSPAVGVRFIVYEDGTLGTPQLVASAAGEVCNEKVLEGLKVLPQEGWMPVKQRGIPVASWYKLNILCKIE